jgi:hypothetical protein
VEGGKTKGICLPLILLLILTLTEEGRTRRGEDEESTRKEGREGGRKGGREGEA